MKRYPVRRELTRYPVATDERDGDVDVEAVRLVPALGDRPGVDRQPAPAAALDELLADLQAASRPRAPAPTCAR